MIIKRPSGAGTPRGPGAEKTLRRMISDFLLNMVKKFLGKRLTYLYKYVIIKIQSRRASDLMTKEERTWSSIWV